MHDVSNAINILDPNLNPGEDGTKSKWKCTQDGSDTGATGDGTCKEGGGSSGSNWKSLKIAFKDASTSKGAVEADTAKHVSGRMTSSDLTRGEKAKISSTFAKAHEGAEIVEIRSISTTSVMVNACARRYTSMMYI